jgi:hypothetical protein
MRAAAGEAGHSTWRLHALGQLYALSPQFPCLDLCGTAILGQQVAIKRIVGVTEEGTCAAVTTLDDVVRMTEDDDTGEAGHAASC